MSYRIEYDYVALRIPKERVVTNGHPDFADSIILGILGGDNNCYKGNQRTRDWSVAAFGHDWEVMQAVVEHASSCEGGCLKPGGRDALAENYIAKVRKIVSAPATLEEASSRGFFFYPRLEIVSEQLNEYHARRYAELCKLRTPTRTNEYGRSFELFEFSLHDASFSIWTDYREIAYGQPMWRKMRMSGRGKV